MTTWTLPCACGDSVTANPDDPLPGVREHNASMTHISYRARLPEANPTARRTRLDLSAQSRVRPVRLRHAQAVVR